RQRPVDGEIAAARDDDALVAEILAAFHQIEDTPPLVALEILERRAVRSERADAGRNDDGARIDLRAGRGFEQPAIALRRQLFDTLVEMEHRRKRADLFFELLDQAERIDRGPGRDVVDRLL